MRKYFISIVLFLFMLLPFNTKAMNIENVVITSVEETKVGEEILLKININFSENNTNNPNSLGVWMLNYEVLFDDTVFIVTDIISDDFESLMYEDGGRHYIISSVKENSNSINKCLDGLLQCSDYEVTIKFFVKNTEKRSSNIGIDNVEAILLMVPPLGEEYNTNNTSLIESNGSDIKTIKIKQSENKIVNEPQNIESGNKPNIDKPQGTATQNTTDKPGIKSSNNYLKSLIIENYELNFDKNKHIYNITLESDINTLDIKAEVEDTKASYQILGSDDLEKSNYKVKIEVTAENGDKSTYTINVEKTNKELDAISDKKSFHIDRKYIIIGCIILGIILVLIIVILIINKVNDKKLNKALDELDKM